MSAQPRIRAVLFDVGGTLVRPTLDVADVIAAEARAVGVTVPAPSLRRVPALVGERLAERARTGIPFSFPSGASAAFWTGIYTEVVGTAASRVIAQEIARRVYASLASPDAYARYPDVLPALRDLAGRGYALGIVSNWERWLRDALQPMGLGGWFSPVIVSAEVGVEKPDPRIFELAMRATGMRPEDHAYVGDSPSIDVAAAERVGLVGILVARDRGVALTGGDDTRVVRTLTDLPGLLDALGRA